MEIYILKMILFHLVQTFFSLPIESDDTYNFKFVVDNYFIKDTTLRVDRSVDISINLDEVKSEAG